MPYVECAGCKEPFYKDWNSKSTRKYCTQQCRRNAKARRHYHRNSGERQRRVGLERKQMLVEKAGGKCIICGYNKCLAALSFHHLDPDQKDFKLDMRSLSNRRLDRILEEFDKCQLLCLNCHAELHWNESNP